MRVTALSMAGLNLTSLDRYGEEICSLIAKTSARVVVMPAYSSLVLGLGNGRVQAASTFAETISAALSNTAALTTWDEEFLSFHASIARRLSIYLVAGTLFEADGNSYYHTAYCFDPEGNLCCRQRQSHLTREEKVLGLHRGEDLIIFSLGDLKAALMSGNDFRHPEVGRILGLLGVDIIFCSGAMKRGYNCWSQAAGVWAQVQQNQFWAVEAQLGLKIIDCDFGAGSAVIGPCEITPGLSGYLARGYPQSPLISAELDETARHRLKNDYPILELLNPVAYKEMFEDGQ
jgi:predicted amidohydrolase